MAVGPFWCPLRCQCSIDAGTTDVHLTGDCRGSHALLMESFDLRGVDGCRTAFVAPLGLRLGDAFHLPFATNVVLELRNGTEDAQHQLACAGVGIDAALVDAAELDTLSGQRFDDAMQVTDRPCQPVEPRDDERVAFPNEVECVGKFDAVLS